MWTGERRGASVLLAGLVAWRADLCRKAPLDSDVWISPPVAICCSTRLRSAGGPAGRSTQDSVLVDLSAVTFIDSSGLATLADAHT